MPVDAVACFPILENNRVTAGWESVPVRLLVVEDDPELLRRLCERLTSAGYAVDAAANARDAADWPDIDHMAAIILDLGLPDGEGLELLRLWRGRGHIIPILILTARGDWRDKVEGLNSGADDFIVKPVRFEELQARLHAMWRRGEGRQANVLRAGQLSLDPVARIAAKGGETLLLSRKEFALLHLFMRRRGHVISSPEILEQLYTLEVEREQNAVEAHISRLRRKIGHDAICTIRGMGYRFDG